jgi:TolA-binding protein
VRLLKDFHRRFPDSTDIPEALLLQARLLIEQYEKYEQAMPFLRALQARYPGHSASQKAEALLRGIA